VSRYIEITKHHRPSFSKPSRNRMTIQLAIIAERDRIIRPKAVSTYDTFPNRRRPVIQALPVVEIEAHVTLGSCPLQIYQASGKQRYRMPLLCYSRRAPPRRRARGTSIQLFFTCIHLLRMCSCVKDEAPIRGQLRCSSCCHYLQLYFSLRWPF
jgi:hypothetical protein